MLYQQLGKGVLFGYLVFLLSMLIQYYIGKLRSQWFEERLKVRDKRTKMLHELFTGMRIVKLYGWEKAFMERVSKTFYMANLN